ncbi:MAG: sigma-70 family RNA polymerase sigma factor [Rhizomicrobium sp.]
MTGANQDESYRLAVSEHGAALGRLARAYEADAELRRDLLQDIHIGLWRSFAGFNGQCSMRTWVYRVAHNIATSHVLRRKRAAKQVSLDVLEELPDAENLEESTGEKQKLEVLMAMIQTLSHPDRQVILLYLEDLDAAAISEIIGLKPGAVATKIHRIKAVLARRFRERSAP